MADDLVWAYTMLASVTNDDGILLWPGKQFILHRDFDRMSLEIYIGTYMVYPTIRLLGVNWRTA